MTLQEPEPVTLEPADLEPSAAEPSVAMVTPMPTPAEFEAAHAYYDEQMARGVARFLEPRRTTCPWCSSSLLKTRITLPDQVQGKPGRFRLDECRTCSHVFQNPRLSVEGLNFYYRDCYDGLGGATAEMMFAWGADLYLARARMVERFVQPRTWLDVGTGYGHFCKEARTVWPDTVFDGLDMGDGVETGQARGWIDNSYRGMLPDLVDEIAGRYDVLSMSHYLEHTRDPRAELDAVARALAPGSYFLVEVPDPECALGRILRRWWAPWGQPQHLNLIPLRNLQAALVERGFTTVAVDRGAAHIPVECTYVVMAMLAAAGPNPQIPWLRHKHLVTRRYATVWKHANPVIQAAYRADKVVSPWIRRANAANSYRILARRNDKAETRAGSG
jgi:SAM-dependent methyltransferase